MSEIQEKNTESESLGLLFGADAIAKAIGNINRRRMYWLLENGHIKCAKKVGGTWTASPRALRREFEGD